MEFASGAMGHISTAMRCTFGYDMRVEVFGSKGLLKHENTGPDDIEFWD